MSRLSHHFRGVICPAAEGIGAGVVVRVRGKCLDWFDVAAQLVRDHYPAFTEPGYQPLENRLAAKDR